MAANSPSKSKKEYRINQEITAQTVRLVEPKSEADKDIAAAIQPGVMSLSDALEQARRLNMDLVEMSPNAEPPVVQIMNFGRFKFKAKKTVKKQKVFKVKEIKLRPVTDEGDYQVKLRNLLVFLASGDKVKVTVRFRGREISHHEIGDRLLDRLEKDVQPYGAVEQRNRLEGRQLVMVIGPTKMASEYKKNASAKVDSNQTNDNAE